MKALILLGKESIELIPTSQVKQDPITKDVTISTVDDGDMVTRQKEAVTKVTRDFCEKESDSGMIVKFIISTREEMIVRVM